MNGAVAFGILLLVMSLSYGGIRYMQTRGLRNNNPGNIRRSGTKWQGLSVQQGDPSFWQFDSVIYGIRAMARILHNYQAIHGLGTVRQIINRWAPPIENDTGAYVDAVASSLGIAPDDHINVDARLNDLTAAIIQHENGSQPYDLATISRGVRMAVA